MVSETFYEVVKTRYSCQPEQAIEPSATLCDTCNSPRIEDTSETETSKSNQTKNMFIPIRSKRKNNKDDPICEAIKLMKTIVEKDPSKDLITFMKEDLERSRQHELQMMQMMLTIGNQQPSWHGNPSSTAGNALGIAHASAPPPPPPK